MNAVTTISPQRRFAWLLRREFWEHRNGLLIAPLVTGLLSLLLTALALFAAIGLGRKANGNIQVNGEQVSINGLDLAALTQQMGPSDQQQLADVVNFSLLLGSYWPLLVMAMVVFFYCLGALYDDRRDRSILFWKSLPVSDLSTVLSKLVTALVVAPLLAIAISALTMFGYLLLMMAAVAWLGGDAIALIWQPASITTLLATHLAWLPTYSLWALPCVGWLLLCSAFARRVPFLWAVVPPLLGGALLSATGLVTVLGISHGSLWGQGVARLLLGTVPGIDQAWLKAANPDYTPAHLPGQALDALGLPSLWYGALFGATCIVLAIVLRRRSDDS